MHVRISLILKRSVWHSSDNSAKKKKPIPRKLRTHNLRLNLNYVNNWSAADGLRELQNFFDGIVTAHKVKLADVKFVHKGKHLATSGVETWTAINASLQSDEATNVLGEIKWNHSNNNLDIINKNVVLREEVLLMGVSDKGYDEDLIGTHGEGLKLGVLSLLRSGRSVTYWTGQSSWKFFLKRARGSTHQTLFYRSNDLTKHRCDLTVKVSDVSRSVLKVSNFLCLAQQFFVSLETSKCQFGSLLKAQDKSLLEQRFSKRLYVKGLFIMHSDHLNEPVNLLRCEVNRDREVVQSDRQLETMIADIWGTQNKHEASLAVESRIYTSRLVRLAQEDDVHLESRAMKYMDAEVAQAVMALVQETNGKLLPTDVVARRSTRQTNTSRTAARELTTEVNAAKTAIFPFLLTTNDDKLIRSSLQQEPFGCSKALYGLLRKTTAVLTVDEALKQAFTKSADAQEECYKTLFFEMAKAFLFCLVDKEVDISLKLGTTLNAFYDGTRLYLRKELVCDGDLEKAVYLLSVIESVICNDGKREMLVDLKGKKFVATRLPSFMKPTGEIETTSMDNAELDAQVPQLPSHKKRRTSANSEKKAPDIEIIDVDMIPDMPGSTPKNEETLDIGANEETLDIGANDKPLDIGATDQVPQQHSKGFERISVVVEGKCHLNVLTPLLPSGNQESVRISPYVAANPRYLDIVKTIDVDGTGGITVSKLNNDKMLFSLAVIPQEQGTKVKEEGNPNL